MNSRFITLALLVAFGVAPSAKDPDHRLAAVRQVAIDAKDALSDDVPVAACLRASAPKTTPLTVVDRADAEAVLTVTGSTVNGDATRRLLGQLGTSCLRATGPDGALWWVGCASLSVVTLPTNARTAAVDVPCGLADALADKLRQAMRKARDAK